MVRCVALTMGDLRIRDPNGTPGTARAGSASCLLFPSTTWYLATFQRTAGIGNISTMRRRRGWLPARIWQLGKDQHQQWKNRYLSSVSSFIWTFFSFLYITICLLLIWSWTLQFPLCKPQRDVCVWVSDLPPATIWHWLKQQTWGHWSHETLKVLKHICWFS